MHKRIIWPLVAALALLGCGDSGTSPQDTGTFEATVSGDYAVELQGAAEFGIYHGEGFGVALAPGDPHHLLGLGHHAQARPAAGTYTVSPPDNAQEFFAMFLRDTPQGLWGLASEEGEVNITTSTASRVEGSFNLVARGFMGGDTPSQVQIEGTFSATCARGARCD